MRVASIVVVLVVACAALAAPTSKPVKMKWVLAEGAPESLRVVIDDQPKIRPVELTRIANLIEHKRKELGRAKSNDERAALRQSIKQLHDRATAINNDELIIVDGKPPTSVGQAGYISLMVCRQVVSETEALVTVHYVVETRRTVKDSDGVHSIPDYEDRKLDAWASGFDTSSWIDDRGVVSPDKPIMAYCDSTRKYDTAGGSTRTVPEIKPFTMDAFKRVPVE